MGTWLFLIGGKYSAAKPPKKKGHAPWVGRCLAEVRNQAVGLTPSQLGSGLGKEWREKDKIEEIARKKGGGKER